MYIFNSRKAFENSKKENHKKQAEAEKQKIEKKRQSIELKKLKVGKKAATTTASKSVKVFETKIFAIEEKLRKFFGTDFV